MKIIIKEKPAPYNGDGSIMLEFWRGNIVNILLIIPSSRPGYAWEVNHPGHCNQWSHFHSLCQAKRFALIAAVLFAHRRPIPIQ